VEDDGAGVGEETVPQRFEPFLTTKASGAGLGLAMCQRIARAQGGVASLVLGAGAGSDGGGACFRLTLPRSAAAAAAA
jgi:two-component system sensor histidine kinase AtoS